MTKFKVGQKVWDEVFCPGIEGVVANRFVNYYQIRVNFGSRDLSYTEDGKYFGHSIPTLSTTPYEVELKGFSQEPPLPELAVDTLIFVRNNENSEWLIRCFSHWGNGRAVCFTNQKKSTETKETCPWPLFSIENPLK